MSNIQLLSRAAVFSFLAVSGAFALPGAQWAQVDPEISNWIRGLVSPASPIPCCDMSDGETTQQDVKQGQYWVQIDNQWWPVPENRVVREGNKLGRPVVWYVRVNSIENGASKMVPIIRCFLPGALF